MLAELNHQLKDIYFRRPSGPDFTESTLEYCDEAAELVIQKYLQLLEPFPPSPSKSAVIFQFHQQSTERRPALPASDLIIQNDKFYCRYSDTKAHNLTNLGRAIAVTNPQLIQHQYLAELKPPTQPTDKPSSHLWFGPRFRRIHEVAGFEGITDIDKILAAGFATQIAKDLTFNQTIKITKSTAGISTLIPDMDHSTNLGRIIDRLRTIRLGQTYISLGLTTQQIVSKHADINEQQLQLIMDVAFIRAKGLENAEESHQMIDPIIRLIAIGDFDQAAYHRDFLLQYFTRSFPDWRIREAAELQDQPTYPTIAHLARAIQKGQLVIDPQSVPDKYQEFFGDLLGKKIHRLERVRAREILSTTQIISQEILQQLQTAYETITRNKRLNELRERLKIDHPEVDAEDIDEGFTILTESGYDPKIFQAVYRGIVRNVSPYQLTYLTDVFINNWESPKKPTTSRSFINLQTVEGKPKIQMIPGNNRSFAEGIHFYENQVTLGRFFYRLVEISFEKHFGLNPAELKAALQNSFITAQSAHPEHSWFTQQEYFNAVFSQFNPTHPNPEVDKFFAELNRATTK